VKKVLLPAPSEGVRHCTVVLCGDILRDQEPFIDELSTDDVITVVRCPEDHEEAFSFRQRLNGSVFVARQAFIEELTGPAILQTTNSGKGSHILAVLESEAFETESAARMLRLGCRGVLPGRFSLKLFRRAVFAILDGELWAPRGVVSELLSDLLRSASVNNTQTGLTPQEARILELSLRGYKNSAIADALFISLETVRWHKRRLNRKLRTPGSPRYPEMQASTPAWEKATG
jgi:DNA-binding NarL/FixJ family response regulator